jgi:putative copper export protein
MVLYEAVVCLHVLAAAVWIGSMAFFALVVVPVVRRAEGGDAGPRLLRRMGARYRAVGWVSLGVLVATGVANLHFHGITLGDVAGGRLSSTPFGHALAYKLSFVVAAIGASFVHEQLMPPDPEAPLSPRARRLVAWSGRLVMLLSLGALFFAVALVRGLP